MHYEGKHLIRPPSEANSIILQVTVGCSHNRCTFCGTYKEERFRIKDDGTVDADIAFAAAHCRRQTRIFLADGDVLIVPQKKLVGLMHSIRAQLPWVNRVSLYGNAGSILEKSAGELAELKALGLDRIYLGLESGHARTLARIQKGATPAAMIEAAAKVRAAGLFLSVTVLLGIAGAFESAAHARATGEIISAMAPNQIGVLTLMLLPGTPLFKSARQGAFTLPDQICLLKELRTMVQHMELPRTQLQTNHASNYLAINARLPRDKEKVLRYIDTAIAGETSLKPEHLRAL